MNLRIITKNHADDSKIGSPLKIDFKAEWTHESMPTAWELKFIGPVLSVFMYGTVFDKYFAGSLYKILWRLVSVTFSWIVCLFEEFFSVFQSYKKSEEMRTFLGMSENENI